MPHFKKKIESILNSKDNSSVPSWALLLDGISILYGLSQRLRAACYRHRVLPSRELPCKVISIGNITVGGTGKTPMTIHVGEMVRRIGFKVVIVSRGYKGLAEKHGGIVSDGRTICMDARMAGDEPYMIACRLKGVPVVVGKNRFSAGMLAISNFQPDVIVLDDAFQHLKLKRDLDLVLLDHMHPFGNSHLLPRGALREPVSALSRSAACILTRCRAGEDATPLSSAARIQKLVPRIPVFTSSSVPYWYEIHTGKHHRFEAVSQFYSANDVDQIKYRKVFCFSGIARNDDFRRTVIELGFRITGFLEFSDHHRYTDQNQTAILRCAEDTGADRLITTEKDYARLAFKKPFPLGLIVVGVKVSFGDNGQTFSTFIRDRLKLGCDEVG